MNAFEAIVQEITNSMAGRPKEKVPMSDVGVIALVPECWNDGLFTTRQFVLSRLAYYFNVVWVNPARQWRQAWFGRSGPSQTKPRQAASWPGLTIYDGGRLLPCIYRPQVLSRLINRMQLWRAKKILSEKGCRKIVLYLWRPEFEEALNLVSHDVSLYHIDDEYSFSDELCPPSDKEIRILGRVNQVVIHSPLLMERKGVFNANTIEVPNGVDYPVYQVRYKEPSDLAAIAKPRIGYIGMIKNRLDLGLVLELAILHRNWNFVFIGPQNGCNGTNPTLNRLFEQPNVHLLGRKPVSHLPAYTQHLDVGMLCYKITDYTNCIYPLKLHEYLAAGIPVVGTPIRSLQNFSGIVHLASGVEQWSDAINMLIDPAASGEQAVRARKEVAARHDWRLLSGKIAQAICRQLGPGYLERFERLRHEDFPSTKKTQMRSSAQSSPGVLTSITSAKGAD